MLKDKVFFWLPRMLGIAFVIFISLFALDVFGEGYAWYEALLAFFIHLVPTYISIVILMIAWKWPRVGALAYFGAGLFYIFFMTDVDWLAIMLISGPLFLTGIFFILSYYVGINKKKNRLKKTAL